MTGDAEPVCWAHARMRANREHVAARRNGFVQPESNESVPHPQIFASGENLVRLVSALHRLFEPDSLVRAVGVDGHVMAHGAADGPCLNRSSAAVPLHLVVPITSPWQSEVTLYPHGVLSIPVLLHAFGNAARKRYLQNRNLNSDLHDLGLCVV